MSLFARLLPRAGDGDRKPSISQRFVARRSELKDWMRDLTMPRREVRDAIIKAMGSTPKDRRLYQVLTDVDDTLYAHVALGVAGQDRRYEKKKLYPCVSHFYNAMYKAYELPSIIVSARPRWTGLTIPDQLATSTDCPWFAFGGDGKSISAVRGMWSRKSSPQTREEYIAPSSKYTVKQSPSWPVSAKSG